MEPEKGVYDKMESGLTEKLTKDNYILTESKSHEKLFGSRYSIWKNAFENDAVRLTWDGKESWFMMEKSPIGDSDNPFSWAEIAVVVFDRNVKDEQYIRDIIESVINQIK